MAKAPTIAIIGGGISGLSAARTLQRLMPAAVIKLFESGPSLGGILQTEHVDGYTVETSADMFSIQPADAYLACEELGVTGQLLSTRPVEQRAFVATRAGIEPVPNGFSLMAPHDLDAIRETKLLSTAAKQELLNEINVAAESTGQDESLESFAMRRFGRGAYEHLIQPLVSGIYTADPRRLSVQATMARFVEMVREHGSIISACQAQTKGEDRLASGARYNLFRAPLHGMGKLVEWMANDLSGADLQTNVSVASIARAEEGWRIQVEHETIAADGVVVATPVHAAANLVRTLDADLATALGKIESASAAVVAIGLDQSQLARPTSAYGIVVPACLGRKIIATSFTSNKFENRAPAGKVLTRTFLGGALQPELVDLPDAELVEIAWSELNRMLGVSGHPELTRVYRWKNCMPQYHVGHLDLVQRINHRVSRLPGLELAGNGYQGVGIPVCVAAGKSAAQRVAAQLNAQ